MNKKVLTLSAVMASMLFGAAAHAADTRIGVTIYKYDDNFMSVVRKAIEQDAKAAPDVQLLMNDSQNDQSKQNDQIDVLLAKGVKALAINLVDPAAAGTVIEKARGQNVPVVFFNKEPSRKALDSYDKAYYVGTEPLRRKIRWTPGCLARTPTKSKWLSPTTMRWQWARLKR